MGKIVRTYGLGQIEDVTVTTTTQHAAYKLGDEVEIYNSDTKITTKYIYIYARNALAKYGLYQITYLNTSGREVGAATFPASSAVYIRVCIPQVAIASGSYGWAVIQGYCYVTSTGNTTIEHYGDGIKSIATCTDSGTSKTIYSVGVYKATQSAGSATVLFNLFNERINIQA